MPTMTKNQKVTGLIVGGAVIVFGAILSFSHGGPVNPFPSPTPIGMTPTPTPAPTATPTAVPTATTLPSPLPLHVITWEYGGDSNVKPPSVPASSYAQYLSYVLTNSGGGYPDVPAAGIKTVYYVDPNRWHSLETTDMNKRLTIADVATTCKGAPILFYVYGSTKSLIYAVDIRRPEVAQKWTASINYTMARAHIDYAYEDNADNPWGSPGPPCDAITHKPVTPAVWAAADIAMEGAQPLPVFFNGLSNDTTTKIPNQRALVAGPAWGGGAEACYASHKFGVLKNANPAWSVTANTEIMFALAHKVFLCGSGVNTDGAVPAALDARLYRYTSFLLTYDYTTSMIEDRWGVGATSTCHPSSTVSCGSNLHVMQETLFVPFDPVLAEPTDIVALLGTDGVYHRQYRHCVLQAVDQGQCDVVVNPSATKTITVNEPFTVHHVLKIAGAGVLDGGTVLVLPGTLASLPPQEGAVAFP
jgi:hypothetical protein